MMASKFSRDQAHIEGSAPSASPVVFVIEDDPNIRGLLRDLLEGHGQTVEDYGTCESFLNAYSSDCEACLLLDIQMSGGMSGLDLLLKINEAGHCLPVVMFSGSSNVQMVVQVMKAGALDFIQKPVNCSDILTCVDRALGESRKRRMSSALTSEVDDKFTRLTTRQRQIMHLVVAGQPSKNIAADLGISQRTVENHRASIMRKTSSKSLPALARFVLAATRQSNDETVKPFSL